MPGHLEKRSGKSWTIVLDVGRDPVTGKRKRIYKAFRGTHREAEKELAKLLAEIERGTYVEPSKLTFGEYLLRWLEDYCRPNLAPSTFDSYRTIIVKHVLPALGTLRLEKLQPLHLQGYYTEKLKSLSQRTVQYHHRVIREALQHAVRWQIVARNAADAVQPPRAKRPDISVPGLEEVKRLLEAAAGHRDYAIICAAVFTGMRRAELLGLRWEDVDFSAGTISVRQTLQYTPEEGVYFTEPKSQKSKRQVVIPPVLVDVLKEHRKRQLENKVRLGGCYSDLGLVFPRDNGEPDHPSNVSHRFKNLVGKLGLRLRFHDLRHLHATILLAQGVHPKVVQERLGHQTVTLTLDTYSHVIPTLQKEAAEKLETLFGRQLGGKTQNGR